ncbi:MAG: isocitrate/isopropylmalate family dehydrogenase, partial [Bacillota bacterium]
MAERWRVAVLPGDGIGPEVTVQAVRVLEAVAAHRGVVLEVREGLIGGAAYDAVGRPLPDETLNLCRASDAVFLGAVGGPKWDALPADKRPEAALLGLRKALGLYANLRPVTPFDALLPASPLKSAYLAGANVLIVRELTGGLYFGEKRRTRTPEGEEEAVDTLVYRTSEIERVV